MTAKVTISHSCRNGRWQVLLAGLRRRHTFSKAGLASSTVRRAPFGGVVLDPLPASSFAHLQHIRSYKLTKQEFKKSKYGVLLVNCH